MYEYGEEATGNVDGSLQVQYDLEDVDRGSVDPFQNPLAGPFVFADGVLAPKPMPDPDSWEKMDPLEHRALFYALCKFNQINRTGVEWKATGTQPDEMLFSYDDTTAFYFVNLYVFLDVLLEICGPTARKAAKLKNTDPREWLMLMQNMRMLAGGDGLRMSVKVFLKVCEAWSENIGIPRDIHAAFADFVPDMCNIFRIRKCAMMDEYESQLASLGGEPFGSGAPDLVPDPDDLGPRRALGTHAIVFAGDGSERIGMLKDCYMLEGVAAKLEVADKILGFDVLGLMLHGPAEKLQRLNGPLMYIAGWAAYEKLMYQSPEKARQARAVAGIDVGELVALSVAGVFPFEVGLDIAIMRSKAMKEFAEASPAQTVCSVAGLTEEKVEEICERVRRSRAGDAEDVLGITTSLFSRGFLVGGLVKAVEKFKDIANEEGALQVKILEGQKAIHHGLMQPLLWVIRAKLREWHHKLKNPWCDIYFNGNVDEPLKASAQVPGKPASFNVQLKLMKELSDTCWKPLRWDRQIEVLIQSGITEFIECGPQKQLKALIKRIDKKAFDNTTNILV